VGCSLPVNGIDPSADPGSRGEVPGEDEIDGGSEPGEDGKEEIEGGADNGEDGKEEIEGGADNGEDGKEEIEGGERDDISSGLLGSMAYMPIVELPDKTVDRSC
jgi:hypothetical protein